MLINGKLLEELEKFKVNKRETWIVVQKQSENCYGIVNLLLVIFIEVPTRVNNNHNLKLWANTKIKKRYDLHDSENCQ